MNFACLAQLCTTLCNEIRWLLAKTVSNLIVLCVNGGILKTVRRFLYV